jgi:N-acylglucosamine 2-epimerase
MDFKGLLEFYEDHLRNHVMPFWLKHCIDWEKGGVFNLIEDDGRVVSTDKLMWSQGRALWTFSSLYNDFERKPDWLELAHNTANFILTYGRDKYGSWAFRLNRDGQIIEPAQSIYVDAFVIYGLTEYAKASGSERAIELAVESYERTSPLLDDHSTLPTRPHPIPRGLQAHGPYMIFSLVFHELGVLTGNRQILERALGLAEIVMNQHLKEEDQILYEFVRPGGGIDNSDAGKTYIPGHVIESMWFMERIYRFHSMPEKVKTAIKATRWHLERGWDFEYGGLFLARHKDHGKPVWHSPDSKLWWPMTESLYALLRFYEVSRHEWCLAWYKRVHDYAFRSYPNTEDGEWVQNLDRFGRKIPAVVVDLPVKDPFHLPRSLIYSIQVLKRLAKSSAPNPPTISS